MQWTFRRTTQTEKGIRYEEVATDGSLQYHTKVQLGGLVFRKTDAVAMFGSIPDELTVTVEPKVLA